MQLIDTNLQDCFLLKPQVFADNRGEFYESFNKKKFNELTNINIDFVQDNQSKSSEGVIRGLHYQKGNFSQAKLVRVIKGRVQDVVVDIRPNSKTFGNYFSIELSESNKLQLFIPRGLAHGFLTLENDTIFSYKCDNFYNKESEAGIIYNDKDLAIKWNEIKQDFIISEKDLGLPKFSEIEL